MKIKKISLVNYRLYRGINNISFIDRDGKNIYLISGQNGFGKTTFLHSLLWCLYGRLMVDIDETIRKDISLRGGYNSFLLYNLNVDSKRHFDNATKEQISSIKRNGYLHDEIELKNNSTYSVSIEFEDIFIPSIPCKSLKITRSYDLILEKENVEILIDGSINELSLGIGNDVFINDFILNKDVARFFFFDSERIVSLAETNTIEERRKLASAYNEVLGVKKYEDLRRNIENLRLRFRKKTSDIENRNKLISLLEKQKQIKSQNAEIDSQIELYEKSLIKLKEKNDSLQVALLREGNGMTLEDLRRLERVHELTKTKDIEYKQNLKSFLEYSPLAIVGQLLLKTKQQIERDYQIVKSSHNIQNQNILISDITSELMLVISKMKINQATSLKLQNDVQDILEKYKGEEDKGSQLITINKDSYSEFLSIFNYLTSTYKSEFEHLAEDYRKNKQTLERTSRQISNMRNNESDLLIKEIRMQKNNVEIEISQTELQIRSLYEKKGNINKDLSTINKLISELSKKVSLNDIDIKKDIVAEELIKELDVFLSSLKQEKKYSLEHRIKNTMNSLMHKEDFIGSVEVKLINDGIDIELYFPNGEIIRKDSLSKGEQQLYATSILKALVDESGICFPVFIDSPLQKFDKSHSSKIITEFYPTISKQVVLFPLLHKELTEEELDLMKPIINSTYLIMNENSYSYFKKIDVESLMKE